MPGKREYRARIVRRAIDALAQKVETGTVTGTLADLVRLLQLEKELGGDEPREVTVRWVDSPTEPSESTK